MICNLFTFSSAVCLHFLAGDANNSTLSPMENHHVIDNDKAGKNLVKFLKFLIKFWSNFEIFLDLMTMSTPPHLLSAVLGAGPPFDDDGSKPRRIFNHRSKLFCALNFSTRCIQS